MDALIASYGPSSESETESDSANSHRRSRDSRQISKKKESDRLPPPPFNLIDSPHTLLDCSSTSRGSRVRSFPHVKGNYALHVFIPVIIPHMMRKELIPFVKKATALVPSLHTVDADIPLSDLCKDDQNLEQVVLGREFHISLGRTVPIRVHQIDSVVAMLRQKLQSQRRYWIEFSKWEVFINDEQTRSFLSMEVTAGGLSEITTQIHAVNGIYKLHNLPEFYENPRPHISLAWALGDISPSLRQAVEALSRYNTIAGRTKKHIFTCKFSGIECKIGKTSYKICKSSDQGYLS